MTDRTLKTVVEAVIDMNDPKYINALMHISQVCQEKADVLRNIEAIQSSYNAAQHEIDKCNASLKELME
jgi:hypothetical protein